MYLPKLLPPRTLNIFLCTPNVFKISLKSACTYRLNFYCIFLKKLKNLLRLFVRNARAKMDETRDHVRAIPRRHFPTHAEDADRPAARVVHRVGHWVAGLVTVQENRFPVDRVLRGHHVHGRAAGHILGNVDPPRENDEQGRTKVDRAPRESANHHIRHHIRLNQVRLLCLSL